MALFYLHCGVVGSHFDPANFTEGQGWTQLLSASSQDSYVDYKPAYIWAK